MALDPEDFKAVMGQWPSGVTVVTTKDDAGYGGMTASSFSSVSLEPPLVSICVARPLAMHDRIQNAGQFAVNILSKDKVEDGLRFAGMLPGVEDRFEGVDVHTAATGCPLLPGMLGWVDCKLWASHDGGDHTIFVGEVLQAGIDDTAAPLLYHSRSWGQFADVLANEAHLLQAVESSQTTVLNKVFGNNFDNPADVESIVSAVRQALDSQADTIVLDDAADCCDPLQLRLTIQAIAGLVGRTTVAFRPGRGAMALANVLVALKSGIHHLVVDAGNEAEVRQMLGRMQVEIK